MKDPENTAKTRTLKTLDPASKGTGFPAWLVEMIRDEYADETYPDCAPRSSNRSMRLSDELERSFKNPPWSLVDQVVRTLDPGGFNSYACLQVPGSTYVQCLCGLKGWHLERRVSDRSGSYVHYRACIPGGSKRSHVLMKNDFGSDGERRDVVQTGHVLEAFHAFHQGMGMPASIDWRVLDL